MDGDTLMQHQQELFNDIRSIDLKIQKFVLNVVRKNLLKAL